jgi:molecular chaperone GrpE (heat shock protein)
MDSALLENMFENCLVETGVVSIGDREVEMIEDEYRFAKTNLSISRSTLLVDNIKEIKTKILALNKKLRSCKNIKNVHNKIVNDTNAKKRAGLRKQIEELTNILDLLNKQI